MHILQVAARYHPHIGGVETHVRMLSERLVQRKHDVDVITTNPNGDLRKFEIVNGVAVRRFRSFAPHESFYFVGRALGEYVKHSHVDVVHIHSAHTLSSFAALSAAQKNVVFTPHYHGPAHTFFRRLLYRGYRKLLRRALKKVSVVICVSNFERFLVARDLSIPTERIVVIPNGVDLHELSRYSHTRRGDESLTLLYVGRFERYKNVDKIVYATRLLVERFDPKRVRVNLVGKGPQSAHIVALIRRLGLEDLVSVRHDLTREELLKLYSGSDVFILPSLHEAYGISAVEALAIGVPTVVANASALKELVETGLAIGIDPPITGENICDAVLRVREPDYSRVMKHVMDWSEVVERILNVYFKVGCARAMGYKWSHSFK